MTLPIDKTVFIVNPEAAMGATLRQWPRIRALAKDRLGMFRTHFTTGPGDATFIARESLLDGAKRIICVGGDGTLNEVVNGFMTVDGPVRPEAHLGFIPLGTGLDFIKSLPIPKEPEKVLDLVAGGYSKRIDLGRIRFEPSDAQPFYRYFHNITSFGLAGEVVERVNRHSKVFGGFISFIWGTFISILAYQKKKIHLKVDDHFDETINAWNVFVANGRYCGGGMCVAPEATTEDGQFHITIIGDLSLMEVFRNLPKLYTGNILRVVKVFPLIGKRVEAGSHDRVPLDVDGEQPGQLPVAIDIIPKTLSIIAA
ncbi:MAG: diacylglycerol kinase family lipid kinase [Deltaproteobacteria bacterium]|nr:diacylglycerol kinase family lipid kinase [Deltaproteobacteria bacterium]